MRLVEVFWYEHRRDWRWLWLRRSIFCYSMLVREDDIDYGDDEKRARGLRTSRS